MSWNDSNGDNDPWKNKGGNQGPPDLDEVVRRMQQKLNSFLVVRVRLIQTKLVRRVKEDLSCL